MSDFKPTARSPLAAFNLPALARSQDERSGVWMNELALLGYITVRGNATDPAFTAAAQSVLGIALPTRSSTFTLFDQGLAIWQSPDEWLLVCSRQTHAALLEKLATALHVLHAQVVDNSGGLTMMVVTGARHVDLLRHVGIYDFESIQIGQAVSTVTQKAGMIVLRQDAERLFVIFRRSFADYLWLLLSKAARPYGLGILALPESSAHPLLKLIH